MKNSGLWKTTEFLLLCAFLGSVYYYFFYEKSAGHNKPDPNRITSPAPLPSPVSQESPLNSKKNEIKSSQPKTNLQKNEPLKSQPRSQSSPKVKAAQAIVKSTTLSGPKYQLPKGTVGFEVKNGRAIAYGDVILGGAPPEFKAKFGAARIPKPVYWDLPIPFLIDQNIPQKEIILDALQYLTEETGLEFTDYDGSQSDAIFFTSDVENCYSYLGRIGGVQGIFLSANCGGQAILHEIMHALGFIHEHSRSDRNETLEVLWKNIKEQFHLQYLVVPEDLMEPYRGLSLDLNSVMIYQNGFFAIKPNLDTMRIKTGSAIKPVKKGLSKQDLRLIRRIYGSN